MDLVYPLGQEVVFYPGALAGIQGVLPSVRLKRLRRGLQDIAYLWLLQQLYYSSTAGADSPVAFSAHVGGFLAGLVFAIVVSFLRVEETVVAPAIEKEISLEQNPGIERASEARLAGDHARARREIRTANTSWRRVRTLRTGTRASAPDPGLPTRRPH